MSVREDKTLFEYAWERKIVMVSPSTLLATLRTIASVLKNENQTRNAVEIGKKAGEMLDKFIAFTEDMDGVGKAIEKAADAHSKVERERVMIDHYYRKCLIALNTKYHHLQVLCCYSTSSELNLIWL